MYTISDFNNKLTNKSWDTVFNNDDVSVTLNSFLNFYWRIFYSSFPLNRLINRNDDDDDDDDNNNNNNITLGIKKSCRHKRELYLAYRNSNNLDI
jgi:hypothetical protein